MKSSVVSLFKIIFLALAASMPFSAKAASAYAGFYSGLVYISISGAVTQPETPTGAVGLTVNDAGAISDGSSLNGTVNGSGVITWQTPNALYLTTGTITGGVVASTGSNPSGGVTTTYRISASNSGGGFGQGGTLGPSLTWRNPKPVSGVWTSVKFANNQFVAVGQTGATATSGDGKNWIFHSTTTTKNLLDVDFGNNVWVAVGEGGTILSSADGITWTPRSVSTIQIIYGVAFGNGKFITVDLAGNIFSSTDGTAWTNLNVPNPLNYSSVDYVNGLFIVGDFTGKIRTSSDGTTWNAAVTAGNSTVYGAAYGAGKYIVSSFNTLYQFTAANGTGATLINGAPSTSTRVVYANNQFLVGVQSNPHTLASSPDGLTWTQAAKFVITPVGFAYGNNTYVGVSSVIEVSTNGTNWSLVSSSAGTAETREVGFSGSTSYLSTAPFNGAAYSPGIRVGDGGVIQTNSSLASSTVSMPSPTRNDLLAVVANNGTPTIAVAVGRKGTILSASIAGPSVPKLWTNQIPVTTADLRSIDVTANIFTIVGANGTILRSANGGTWTTISAGTVNTLNKIYYSTIDSRYVAVGDNGTILTSPDGTAWTTRVSGVTNRIVGVAAAVSKLIAVTEDGLYLRSVNAGTNWVATPFGVPYKVKSIAASTGGFLAVGEGGVSINSTDGTNWFFTAGAGFTGYNLAQGNGRFVGAGGQGAVSSTDGITWVTGDLVTNSLQAITYAKGMFVGGGAGFSFPARHISTSVDGIKWGSFTTPHLQAVNGLTYANGLFVSVGDAAELMTSPDGTNWVNRSITSSLNQLRSVAYGAGKYVAVGDRITRYSSDGTNWTANDGFIAVNSVTFANNLFVTVGTSGAIRTSPDGVTWASQTSGTNVEFKAVTFANGKFVAAGVNGVLATSTNGTNWTSEFSNFGQNLRGAIAANGNLLLTGDGGAILQTSFADTTSPVITQHPTASQTLNAGQTLTLQVVATGAPTLQYYWLKDGAPLADGGKFSGVTTDTLTVTGLNALDAGTYSVAVFNSSGSRLSNPAQLTVNGPPIFTIQPVSVTTSNGLATNLTALAEGPGPIGYQWRKGGVPLTNDTKFSGVLTTMLTITGSTGAEEGPYSVVATNAYGGTASADAQLNVNRAPTITGQPQTPVNISQGQTLTLTVQVDGTGPFTYQWKNNGVSLANGGSISGATSNVLTITGAVVANAGLYSVAVTNAFGNATSANAAVTVIGPGSFRPEFGLTNAGIVNAIQGFDNGEYLIVGSLAPLRMTVTGATSLTPFSVPAYTGSSVSIAAQPNGQFLLGGTLTASNNGTNFPYLARINSDGSVDPSVTLTSPQRTVVKVMRQPDGKFIVGTTLLGFAAADIRRYNADGSLDGTFTPTTFNFQLFDIALFDDGRILAGGQFTQTSGQGASYLSLINTNGVLISSFGAGFNSPVIRTYIGPDGKVFISDNNHNFVRNNANGTLDSSFNCTVLGQVTAMAFLTNGNILIGGNFNTVNGATTPYLSLIDASGALVGGFTSPLPVVGGGIVNAIQMLPDGSALIGDNVQVASYVTQRFVQRIQIYSPGFFIDINPLSQAVNRFGSVTFTAHGGGTSAVSYQWRKNGNTISGATNATYTIPVVTDGDATTYDVIVSNASTSATSKSATLSVLGEVVITQPPMSLNVIQNSTASFGVTATGATPLSYQWRKNGTNISGATSSTCSFTALTNDAGIYSVEVGNAFGSAISRDAGLSVVGSTATPPTPGTLNTNVVPGTPGVSSPLVYDLAVDTTGRIMIVGSFTTYAGQTRNRFMRLNGDLSLDALTTSIDNGNVTAVLPLAGGGFAVGGSFSSINSATVYGLAFFDAATNRLAQPVLSSSGTFGGSSSAAPGGFFRQPDGKILLGGNFTTMNGAARTRIARVNADGSLDNTFAPTDNPSGVVFAMGMDAAGNVLVSGNFGAVGAVNRTGLARYTTNGVLDTTFTTQFNVAFNPAYGFALQSSGKVLVYGTFSTIGGQTRYGIARLDTAGAVDTTFNANLTASQAVYDAIVEADDRILVAGTFTTVNGVTRRYLARLTAEGALDTTFGTTTTGPASGGVYAIAKLPDGGLVVGGNFSTYDGVSRLNLAKLNYTPLPLPALGIVQQPLSASVLAGKSVTFSVSAVGTAPLSYQWRIGTTQINNATNATYTLSSVQGGDVGDYNVVVTDANSNTTSQDATLSLQTGLTYAAWLASKGLTAGVNDGPGQDADGDGVNNLIEYVFGTNPNDNTSVAKPTAVTVQVGGQFYRAVRFIRQKNITDVTITVTTGSNLKFTAPLATTLMPSVDLGNGAEEITIRTLDPTASTPVVFFHTQVSQP